MVRNPVQGDKVLISFGESNQFCEVTQPYSDGAVMVKEYPGVIYPPKSKGDDAPYWEWPA